MATFPSSSQRTRIPLRVKITAPFLAAGLVLLLSAVLIAFLIVYENLAGHFNNQLFESSQLAAEAMVGEENRLLAGLRQATYTQGVPEAILARDADGLRALIYPLAANQGIEAVEVLDAQGNLLLSMRRRPSGQPLEYEFSSEGDASFSYVPFVEQALAGLPDERGDKYAGLVQASQREYFYVAGPVNGEQGRVVGAVLAGTSLDSLAAHLSQQTGAQVTLYHPDGLPLASTSPATQTVEEGLAGQIAERGEEESYRRRLGQAGGLASLLNRTEELLSPWRARSEGIGMFGITQSRSLLVGISLPTRLALAALLSLGLVLMILAGWIVGGVITRRLARLEKAAREVSLGNLSVQAAPSTSSDELSDLDETFYGMVASLQRTRNQMAGAFDSTILGWSQALDRRERETPNHSQRLADWTVELARAMGMYGEALDDVRRGALLHDIGKTPISDNILLKSSPLTDEEFAILRRHPLYAWEFLSPVESLRPALEIPYCHHERWDGMGYPRGLKGEEIPLAARIFAVVDAWDALTHDRIYRSAVSRDEAQRIIQEGRGSAFDPQVIDLFLRMLPGLEARKGSPNER